MWLKKNTSNHYSNVTSWFCLFKVSILYKINTLTFRFSLTLKISSNVGMAFSRQIIFWQFLLAVSATPATMEERVFITCTFKQIIIWISNQDINILPIHRKPKALMALSKVFWVIWDPRSKRTKGGTPFSLQKLSWWARLSRHRAIAAWHPAKNPEKSRGQFCLQIRFFENICWTKRLSRWSRVQHKPNTCLKGKYFWNTP